LAQVRSHFGSSCSRSVARSRSLWLRIAVCGVCVVMPTRHHSLAALVKRRERASMRGYVCAKPRSGMKYVEVCEKVAVRAKVIIKSLEVHNNHEEAVGQRCHFARVATHAAAHLLSDHEHQEALRNHRAAGRAKHVGPPFDRSFRCSPSPSSSSTFAASCGVDSFATLDQRASQVPDRDVGDDFQEHSQSLDADLRRIPCAASCGGLARHFSIDSNESFELRVADDNFFPTLCPAEVRKPDVADAAAQTVLAVKVAVDAETQTMSTLENMCMIDSFEQMVFLTRVAAESVLRETVKNDMERIQALLSQCGDDDLDGGVGCGLGNLDIADAVDLSVASYAELKIAKQAIGVLLTQIDGVLCGIACLAAEADCEHFDGDDDDACYTSVEAEYASQLCALLGHFALLGCGAPWIRGDIVVEIVADLFSWSAWEVTAETGLSDSRWVLMDVIGAALQVMRSTGLALTHSGGH